MRVRVRVRAGGRRMGRGLRLKLSCICSWVVDWLELLSYTRRCRCWGRSHSSESIIHLTYVVRCTILSTRLSLAVAEWYIYIQECIHDKPSSSVHHQ